MLKVKSKDKVRLRSLARQFLHISLLLGKVSKKGLVLPDQMVCEGVDMRPAFERASTASEFVDLVANQQLLAIRTDLTELKDKYERVSNEKADLLAENAKLKRELNALKGKDCDEVAMPYSSVRRRNREIILNYTKSTPIIQLPVSSATLSCLLRGGFSCLGDLEDYPVERLLQIPQLGNGRLNEISDLLRPVGVSLRK